MRALKRSPLGLGKAMRRKKGYRYPSAVIRGIASYSSCDWQRVQRVLEMKGFKFVRFFPSADQYLIAAGYRMIYHKFTRV